MKSNKNSPFEKNNIIVIASEYQEQKESLLINKSLSLVTFIDNDDMDNPIIDFEDVYPDDPDHSIENAIALTYIEYLISKDIPVTEKNRKTIRTQIKTTLLDCKKLAEKDKPDKKAFITEMINVYDVAKDEHYRPDSIHPMEAQCWNKMESTPETDENLL